MDFKQETTSNYAKETPSFPIKKHLKSIVALVSIVAVMGLLLAITNSVTAPIIAENEAAAASGALKEVFPEGTAFEVIDVSGKGLPPTVKEAHKETSGKGYVFKLETSGYGNGLILMCGVSVDGTITGATCIASNETNGAENSYGAAFAGKDLAGAEAVDVVAGSTVTSKAYGHICTKTTEVFDNTSRFESKRLRLTKETVEITVHIHFIVIA